MASGLPAYENYLGSALGAFNNIQKGGPKGDVAAGAGAARLGAQTGVFGESSASIGAGASDVLGGLEVAQGLQRGGVAGYGEAAIGAGRIGIGTGLIDASSTLGRAIPGVGAALGVYNFAKNWRSGATGSDTLSGLEAGASIGALGGPIGSLIGAGVGAAVGAVSSIFGPGKTDAENLGWDQYAQAFQTGGAAAVAGATPAQNFQMLAGIFDSRGSSIPFYGKYGRMGENQFMSDMTSTINQAVTSGKISPNASPAEIYSQVVEPWINSMSPGGWQNTSTIQGAPEKQAVGQMLTNLIGQYQSGQITSSTPLGIAGQTVPIQPFAAGQGTSTASLPTPTSVGTTPGYAPGPHVARDASVALSSPSGASPMPTAPQYQLNDPTGMGTVPMVPQVGSGGSTSPPGVASPATSPVNDSTGFGGLSPLESTGILTGIGLLGAGYAQNQSAQTIKPITAVGAPYVGAGQELLGDAMNNQLTPQQSQVVSTAQSQGSSLIQAATPVGQIAQGLFQQFQSGNLKPADQAQLDQQVTAAKAQIAQMLGPNVDSTTLSTYYNQIDQQALITKQNVLNGYFSTGNQAFDTWSTTTQAGQAAILAGQEYAVTSIDNTFAKAIQAGSLGGQDILAGIQAQLQSNNQLATSFGNYMSNLAKAYGLSQYAQSGGTGGAPSDLSTQYGSNSPAGDVVGSNLSAAAQPGINQTSSQINTDFNNTLGAQVGGYQTPAPSGSVSVGEPGATDVMSQISPSFSNTASMGVPSYASYAGYA